MRRLPLLLAVGQLALGSIGSVGIARAQSPPRGAPSPAQRLREQGSAEANAGRLPEALAAWRAAWALSPGDRSLACDIGRGELLSGHDVEAARWMSRCVRLTRNGGTPRGVERRRAEVVDLAVARSRVAEISLAVEDGAALLLDGKSLGAAPLGEPLFVEPGRHRIEARKGTKTASATVDAVAGQEHRVSLVLKVEPPPFAAPETKEPKEMPRAPLSPAAPLGRSPQAFVWWPVVTGAALTVTTVGVGAASWFVGSTAHDEADLIGARILADTGGKSCGKLSNHPECEAFGAADRRRVAFTTAATGLFIAGGIVAAATLGYAAYEKDRVSVSITAGGAVGRYAW